MKKLLTLYKNEGETPLECLKRFRKENLKYKDAVLSYLGRLDPMAVGLLLVVVDEENKNREKYLNLDKTYEVEILFGVKTDTGDILGKILTSPQPSPKIRRGGETNLNDVLNSFVGEITLPYPNYSSKPVNGKSLFQWSREGKINEIEIPNKTSKIYSIKLINNFSINSNDLLVQVIERIKKVKGDFRQEKIINTWEQSFGNSSQNFEVIRIEVSCSSGTYMRSLAEAVALKLGTTGLALRIKRVRVGEFSTMKS